MSEQKKSLPAPSTQAVAAPNQSTAVARALPTDGAGNPIFSDYADLVRFSGRMLAAEVLPAHIRTAPRFELIFLMLQRLGVNALNSMKNTWVNKNGTIEIYGNVPLAACRAHPDFIDIEEYHVDANYERRDATNFLTFKAEGAVCIVKRRGQGDTMGVFSVGQAARAGLLNKPGPWQQYQDRMLTMRARTMALRDAFTDVFEGVAIREMDEYVDDETGAEQAALPPAPKGRELAAAKSKQFAAPRKSTQVISADEADRVVEAEDTPERAAAREAFEKGKLAKAEPVLPPVTDADRVKMREMGYDDEPEDA